MSNLTFDIKCIRADPQAGICENTGLSAAGSAGSYAESPVTVIITWNTTTSVIQHVGKNICHLSMLAIATTPLIALSLVICNLPVGFRPTQDILGVPYATFIGGFYNQSGTVDILTNGDVTNFTTGFDQSLSEYFVLDIIFPC